jgi:2-isopropylmalate synthase
MIKNRETYEIMTPASVGLSTSNLVMGKHSGRNAFKQKLDELGYALGGNEFQDAFKRFKDLADHKKHVFEEDIIALVDDAVIRANDHIQVGEVEIYCGSNGQRAILTLHIDGEERTAATKGNGPVDALFNAIRKMIPHEDCSLQLYQVHAVTAGTDAQAEVTVRLSENGRFVQGTGTDADTMVASARAYVNALNKLLLKRGKHAMDPSAGIKASA